MRPRMTRRNCGIVEQAKAHRPRGLGMMTGRPGGDKGIDGLFRQHLVDRMNGAARGTQRRFEGAGRHRSIGVELHQTFGRRRIAELRDVIHRVTSAMVERSSRRLDARKHLEFLRLECVRDGAKPVGPLGMTKRHQVFETGGVGDEQRGHESDVLLSKRRVGASYAERAFDDSAFEPGRLDGEILGEKPRQSNARTGIGIDPHRRERLLGQQTAPGGDGKQPQIGRRSGQRLVHAPLRVGKHPARSARQARNRLLQPYAAPAERRIVGRIHRIDDAAQFAEIRFHHGAAIEGQLAR